VTIYLHIIAFLFRRGPAALETLKRTKTSTLLFVTGIAMLLGFLILAGGRGGPQDCQSCHTGGPPAVHAGQAPKLPPGHPSLPAADAASGEASGKTGK
jgi:hypothetical protein